MIPAHGGQLRALAARFGVEPGVILDFSANINPDGPPASVLAALRTALDRPETLTSYPDLELYGPRSALATHLAVAPESLAIGNGFVPLLEAVVRTSGLRRCLLPVPAFTEYRRTLELCGVTVIPFPLQDFIYKPDAMLDAIQQSAADSLLLANPQNPSGSLTLAPEMLRLIERAGKAGVQVLLDEAFIDYTPAESMTAQVKFLPNLVVFRSVTKFFAMPGLRVAYAVLGDAARVNRVLPPWPISSLAAEAVIAALTDQAFERKTRAHNLTRRIELEHGLHELGIHTAPAAANFLLLRLPTQAASVWESLLREHHILLRSCVNFEGLAGEYLRTAVRTKPDNARLLSALKAVLRP